MAKEDIAGVLKVLLKKGLCLNKKTKTTQRHFLVHYGWIVVLTGAAVLFAGSGLGRFSLGMLLPSMGSSLGLSYSQMGILSAGNFTGYMMCVSVAGIITQRLGARYAITVGLALVGVSMTLVGRANGFSGVLTLYLATGIGTGLVNVPLMGLVPHWFYQDKRGLAAGVMISGNGMGIVFAGFYIPYINAMAGAEGWRMCWVHMGLMSLAVAALTAACLRNRPAEKKLAPVGRPFTRAASSADGSFQSTLPSKRWIIPYLGGIYSLFGSTYVVYATFIVTELVQERGLGEHTAGSFWAIAGGLSIISGPLFGCLSDRLGRKKGMLTAFSLFAVAYILVAARLSTAALYGSIALFGISLWSIPTIMSAAVGDYAGPERATQSFGTITLFFGGGQIIGPFLAGLLADYYGTIGASFWMCAVLCLWALVLVLFLKENART